MPAMDITRIENGAFRENAWLAVCGGEAALVDPGGEPERLAAAVRASGAELREVLLTHGHVDHISALGEVLAAFPAATVRISGEDEAWCFTPLNEMPPYRVPRRPEAERVSRVRNGDSICLGGTVFSVLATPGHSPGSVCYFAREDGANARGILFSGDTLFARTIGRTDLPGGDDAAMERSLALLAALPPQTLVLPGHGPETTISTELATNPFLHRHG